VLLFQCGEWSVCADAVRQKTTQNSKTKTDFKRSECRSPQKAGDSLHGESPIDIRAPEGELARGGVVLGWGTG